MEIPGAVVENREEGGGTDLDKLMGRRFLSIVLEIEAAAMLKMINLTSATAICHSLNAKSKGFNAKISQGFGGEEVWPVISCKGAIED